MTTLQDQLATANLSNECKIDLMTHVEQVELQNSTLPKRATTVADGDLPSAVFATTATARIRADAPDRNGCAAVERFSAEKSMHEETQRSAMAASAKSGGNASYSKRCPVSYHDCPKKRNPFVESRSRATLSGKEECFVRRYTGALTKSAVPREPKTDEASVASSEAYRAAFRRYTGRDPTDEEMEEVDRLSFSFDDKGNIGVLQKPHTCYPHSHITSSTRRCVKCESQVYHPEVPAVRGARDRFPGPVPVWSSTKNLSTMVSGGGMHEPGHRMTTGIQANTVDTVVGPK